MQKLRRCRWCRRPLTDNLADATNTPRLRKAHCRHPQCDWCEPCKARREAAIAAGRPDLLEPEKPAETTQELPAVRDGEPPIDPNDQMT